MKKINPKYDEENWLKFGPDLSTTRRGMWPDARKAYWEIFNHYCLGHDLDESIDAKEIRFNALKEFYDALQSGDAHKMRKEWITG